jgi:hypothetical protein
VRRLENSKIQKCEEGKNDGERGRGGERKKEEMKENAK